MFTFKKTPEKFKIVASSKDKFIKKNHIHVSNKDINRYLYKLGIPKNKWFNPEIDRIRIKAFLLDRKYNEALNHATAADTPKWFIRAYGLWNFLLHYRRFYPKARSIKLNKSNDTKPRIISDYNQSEHIDKKDTFRGNYLRNRFPSKIREDIYSLKNITNKDRQKEVITYIKGELSELKQVIKEK